MFTGNQESLKIKKLLENTFLKQKWIYNDDAIDKVVVCPSG